MFNIFKLIKYTFLDIKNRKNKKKDISGVWWFCGLYGQGKTLSMVKEAYKLKQLGFNIYSNFGVEFEDGSILHWRDILELPPNSVVLLDEVQNTFNSRSWKDMPLEFITLLTQNRKLNIRIMGTAQIYEDMDRVLRDLARYIVQCKKVGRLIINTYYDKSNYVKGDTKKKSLFREYFVAEDSLFELYDTYKFVEKLKGLDEYKSEKKVIKLS